MGSRSVSNQEEFNELQWKKFPVLNDGYVTLVDAMGDDGAVCQAARVSYGNDLRGFLPEEWLDIERMLNDDPRLYADEEIAALKKKQLEMEKELEKATKKDRDLIRYMMRHRHSTPFEQAEIKLLVRVPMDCWRQWIRHRTANVNEYSTRYSEAINVTQKTPPDKWRLQSQTNKQGSADYLVEWPEGMEAYRQEAEILAGHSNWEPGKYLSYREQQLQQQARDLYEERLLFGIAREQARKDLPLSTYTEAYWKIDLHNIFHFLALRMDAHAQKEIRDYATIIGEQIVKPLFPICWEAFADYRLEAMALSRLDIEVIRALMHKNDLGGATRVLEAVFQNKRERDECCNKLQRLGFLIP